MARTTMEVEKSTLTNLKQIGRKNQTYDQLIAQRITCDAVGCQKLGSIALEVNAGRFGTVKLFVCADCVGKFTDDSRK